MPMWVSEDGEEMVAIGSIAELKERSGVEVRSTFLLCCLFAWYSIDCSYYYRGK